MKKCGSQPPCWFLLILAQFSLSENFELSSSPSVIGNVGEDAVLPCQISLGTQPEKMEVQWKKHHDDHYDDIYEFAAFTHRETFGPGYQARAMLATMEGIATGNVSLKLKKIQVRDGGIYKCIVQTRDLFAETQTVLRIAALGNVSIEVLGPEGEGIKLACKSAGWYPKPELRWLTKHSQHPQTESSQDHEQLFSVWSNITAMRDMREITCLVHDRNHLQMKRESTILLSRDIFPHFPTWLLAFWILFILTVLAVVAAVYFRHQGKQKRKHNEEEQMILLGRPRKHQAGKRRSLNACVTGRSAPLQPGREARRSAPSRRRAGKKRRPHSHLPGPAARRLSQGVRRRAGTARAPMQQQSEPHEASCWAPAPLQHLKLHAGLGKRPRRAMTSRRVTPGLLRSREISARGLGLKGRTAGQLQW